MSTGREIRLVENPDGQWTATDTGTGLTAQGPTKEAALETLDDVVEAATGDGGREPTDEEISALGVDPETARSQGDLPDVLQD
jgi:N-acetylglucosamine kinase-like BadF-type ATPase